MSATIVWSIDWMVASAQTINGFSEIVLSCGWRCTGTQTNTTTPSVTYTDKIFGACSFTEPAAGSSFTPYAQLTQAQVLGWCWQNGVNQTAIEEAVNVKIAAQINPSTIQPSLPWPSIIQPPLPLPPATA